MFPLLNGRVWNRGELLTDLFRELYDGLEASQLARRAMGAAMTPAMPLDKQAEDRRPYRLGEPQHDRGIVDPADSDLDGFQAFDIRG